MKNKEKIGNIGLIGLGKIGSEIAKLLLKKDFSLYVFDKNIKRMKPFTKGGSKLVQMPSDMSAKCCIIFLALPDPQEVALVVEGKHGLLSNKNQNYVIVDLSTNSPDEVIRLAKECKKSNVFFLDAPISGGIWGASRANLLIMIAGDRKIVEFVRPVLKSFATSIVYIGGQGDAAKTKLIHNMIGEIEVQAFAEAFCLAAKLGLNLEQVFKALSYGMASSRVLTDLYANGALLNNSKVNVSMNTAIKDQELLLSMGNKVSAELLFSRIGLNRLYNLRNKGYGKKDITNTIRYFEQKYDVKVNLSEDALNKNN